MHIYERSHDRFHNLYSTFESHLSSELCKILRIIPNENVKFMLRRDDKRMTRASRRFDSCRIYYEDALKIETRDDPVRVSRSDKIIVIDHRWMREAVIRRAPGGCGCICGRDTRKWRLRPVRINWKWAVRADTTVLISSTTWRTHASPPCTPRCLLRPSSREPTLRLLCTSRTPVSFLPLFYVSVSPFVWLALR